MTFHEQTLMSQCPGLWRGRHPYPSHLLCMRRMAFQNVSVPIILKIQSTDVYSDVDVNSRHRLRSASTAQVLVPATRRSTIGDRALAVAGPRAWINLPVDLRLSRTFSTFKTYFNISFSSVWLYHTTLFHHKYGMVVEKQEINKTKNTLNCNTRTTHQCQTIIDKVGLRS